MPSFGAIRSAEPALAFSFSARRAAIWDLKWSRILLTVSRYVFWASGGMRKKICSWTSVRSRAVWANTSFVFVENRRLKIFYILR